MKLTSGQIKNSSLVAGSTITDALNTLRTSSGSGTGDMVKTIYDTDNDGKVDVANLADSVPWTGVTDKPVTFTPTLHNHPVSEVTGLQSALGGKANSTHTHAISDVTGLQTALDGKQDTLVSGTNIKTINGDSLLGSGNLVISGGGGGGTSDHGALTGLADDDHTQYHNDARGDARYSQLGHTHSNATTSVDGFMSAADKTKLDGIAAGATANSSNATLLNRNNHTGTQGISTVNGLQTALDGKQATLVSGTNIKTINGNSLLGSGNLTISGGSGLAFQEVTGTTQIVSLGAYYHMTNAAATTLTAPASASPGDEWGWAVCNGRVDNVINWSGLKHEGISDATLTLSSAHASGRCTYVNATFGWKIK